MTPAAELRALQRRHALSRRWSVRGHRVVQWESEGYVEVAVFESAEAAQLAVDMHKWFGKLLNTVIMMNRAKEDQKQMREEVAGDTLSDAGDAEIERRLRLLEDTANPGEFNGG